MPTDLAALLVQEGAVAGAIMERALARQRALGGSLDTALLEMGAVGEARIVEAASRATQLPPAPPSAWEAADARARRVFPSRVAERHGLAPFALDGRELSLAATYPVDLGLLEEISFMLSLHLRAHVAPEWRVRSLVHRLYGGTLEPRAAALAERGGGPDPAVVAAVGAGPGEQPPRLEDGEASPDATSAAAWTAGPAPVTAGFARDQAEPLEPLAAALAQALETEDFDLLDEAAEEAIRASPAPALESPAEPPAEQAPDAASPERDLLAAEVAPEEEVAPALDRTAAPRWTLNQARAALAAVRSRDELVQVALRYTRDFFEFAALFAVTRDAVAGYDALGPEEDARDRCRGTAIYTDDPGVFRTVIETRAPYLGPVPVGLSGNEAILGGLGRGNPRTVLVCPVVVRDRTVCILYADNGQAPVSAGRLATLLLFQSWMGLAFERLIRERKRRQDGAEAVPVSESAQPFGAAGPAPEVAAGVEIEAPAEKTSPAAPPEPSVEVEAVALADSEPAVELAPAAEAVPPAAAPAAPAAEEHAVRPAPVPPPPEELDFDIDVDVEALAALEQEASPDSLEAEIARLVAAPAGTPRRAQSVARLAAQGDRAIQALVAALPGPLEDGRAHEPARVGPVPAALSLHGAAAVPLLVGVLPDPDPARRRCAVVLLGAAAEPSSFVPLTDRVLDADEGVSAAAAEALARNRRHPAMRAVRDRLHRFLLSGVVPRAGAAARALGALRDVEAIPLLIQVLETLPGPAADAAGEALCRITLVRLGADVRRWLRWWKDNRGRGRAEWLFAGLTSDDRAMREAAADELGEAAPSPVQYSPDASPAERQASARAWAGWWARSGRAL